MAQSFSTFYDDFNLPGLDRSKWGAPTVPSGGAISFPPNQGLQLTPSSTAYTMFDSRLNFDISNNSVYIGPISADLTGNTASTAFFEVQNANYPTDGFRLMFVIFYSAGFKIQARLYNSSGTQVTGSTGPLGTVTIVYNSNQAKYLRFQRTSSGRFNWQYSADAANWVTLAYVDNWAPAGSPLLQMHVHLAAGTGSATNSYFRVRRINMTANVDRGSGYVYDTFDTYPILSVPTYSTSPPTQFGQWQLRAGSASIVQDPNDSTLGQNTLSLQGSTGTTATFIAAVPGTIKDVDFRTSWRIQSTSTTPSGRIMWRYQDDSNYWYLNLVQGTATLGYRQSGTDTNLTTATTLNSLTTYFTFRVIHVGSEIVVYADTGFGTSTYGRLTEIIRTTGTGPTAAGLVGFKATSETVYIKDVTVGNGVTPAAPITFTTSDPTQVKPANWKTAIGQATAFEYMYLQDNFGNILNIAPTYGDIFLREADLGAPVARQVQKTRPLGNGSQSYTRFYSEKSVSLSLSCYKYGGQEAQYYSDLIQRWCQAGRKFQLVYKPRGDGERYINMEGTSLGRAVKTRIGNQRIDVDAAWLAVDGGDYETATQSITVTPGSSAYLNSTGSLETEGIIRIIGPCSNPVIYNQTIEAYFPGRYARLGLNLTLDSTEFVDLDLKERDVRYMGWTDSAASYRQYLTTRDWFGILPGRNSLSLTTDLSNGSARIQWSDKF